MKVASQSALGVVIQKFCLNSYRPACFKSKESDPGDHDTRDLKHQEKYEKAKVERKGVRETGKEAIRKEQKNDTLRFDVPTAD